MAGGTAPGPALPGADDLAWVAVPDAPGLLRAEIAKADGRRLTVYCRRPGAGGS